MSGRECGPCSRGQHQVCDGNDIWPCLCDHAGMAFPLHCGRLGTHSVHVWTHRRTYHCSGRVLIEGGWFGSDAADDAAEEAAMTERRETA